MIGKRRDQAGQSLVEYVMLIAIVIGLTRILFVGVPSVLKRLETAFKDPFARTYKYGRPDACGIDGDPPSCGGSPQNHPRFNGRMFGRKS